MGKCFAVIAFVFCFTFNLLAQKVISVSGSGGYNRGYVVIGGTTITVSGSGNLQDTTTNFYVYSDLHLDQVLADSIDAPTDSIFVMENVLLDSTHTISVSCFVGAYDFDNRPVVFGADTIKGWTAGSGLGDVEDSVIAYPSQSADDIIYRPSSYSTGGEYIRVGNPSGDETNSAIRFRGITIPSGATIDSAFITLTSYYSSQTSTTVKFVMKGEDTAAPNAFSNNTDAYSREANLTTASLTNNNVESWIGDGTGYRYTITSIIQELNASYSYSTGDIAIFVMENSSSTNASRSAYNYDYGESNYYPKLSIHYHTTSLTNYKKIVEDSIYQVYFGDNLGTEVSDASLVDGNTEWCRNNDTFYVADTTSVFAVLRNGIEVTAGSTIAGFDIQKTHIGIKTSGTVDSLILRQNRLTSNVYGILDSADGVSFLNHNVFASNLNNLYLKYKDTAYVYNNTFYSMFSSDIATNFISNSSKLVYKNNFTFVGYPKVAVVDNISNVLAWDYNGYGYYYGGVDSIFSFSANQFDSLQEFQDSTAFDDHSFDIGTGDEIIPYSSMIYIWNDFDGNYNAMINSAFMPRIDSIVTSPLLSAAVDVGLTKDFNNNQVPNPAHDYPDIGAIETYPQLGASLLYASMYNYTDSALAIWNYNGFGTVDSIQLILTDIDNFSTTLLSVGDTTQTYLHPTWKTTQTAASITGVYPSIYYDTDSCKIIGWLNTGNDTTTWRVSWGISSMTDSSSQFTDFVFLPYNHTIIVKVYGNGETAPTESETDTLTHLDNLIFSYTIKGLSKDTTYKVRVVANNSAGWTISDTSTFRIATGSTPLYTIYMPKSKNTEGDSLGSLLELQQRINAGSILPGTSVKLEKGGTWTTRGGNTRPYSEGEIGLDLTNLKGTADNYITFETYGTGEKPRFDFTGYGDMIYMGNTEYIKIDGLSLYNSGTYTSWNLPRIGISAKNVSGNVKHIEINNCLIRNTGGGVDIHLESGYVVDDIKLSGDTIRNTWGGDNTNGAGRGCGFSSIASSGNTNISVDNCVFIDNNALNPGGHEHGIYLHDDIRTVTITNSVFTDGDALVSSGSGIKLAGGANITISGNQFSTIREGIQVGSGQSDNGRVDSVYIFNNTFTNMSGMGIRENREDPYYAYSVHNHIKIYNNQFYDMDAYGVHLYLITTLTNFLMANNTFVNCRWGGFYYPWGRPSVVSNNKVYNNIFVNTENTTDMVYFRSDVFDEWNYNLYYRTSGSNLITYNGIAYSLANFQDATSYEPNGINDNPDFVNIGTYDLHLTAPSPAVNTGIDLSTHFTTDFEGGTRGVFDIGFDEYGVP